MPLASVLAAAVLLLVLATMVLAYICCALGRPGRDWKKVVVKGQSQLALEARDEFLRKGGVGRFLLRHGLGRQARRASWKSPIFLT